MNSTNEKTPAKPRIVGNADHATAQAVQDGASLDEQPQQPQQPISRWGGLRSIKQRGWSTRKPTPTPTLLFHTDRSIGCHGQRNAQPQTAVPRGALVMFVGPGGMGKSMATMQLAIAVTTGKNWLGFAPAAPGGVVVLICAEDDENTMHDRFLSCAQKMGIADDEGLMAAADALIHPLPGDDGVPALFTHTYEEKVGEVIHAAKEMEQLTDELRQIGEASAQGLALIILDPIVKFMPTEGEERAAIASKFIEVLKEWTYTLPGKPTVMLVHHTTKTARKESGHTAEAARGSSSLTDSVRCQLNLFDTSKGGAGLRTASTASSEQGAEKLWLCVSKSNYGPTGYAIPIMRDAATGALGIADYDHDTEDSKPNKSNASSGTAKRNGKATKNAVTNYLDEY
jgi:regulatory protein RepA